jgi:WD40 repeat protein
MYIRNWRDYFQVYQEKISMPPLARPDSNFQRNNGYAPQSVAVSSQGTLIATSASQDNSIIIWDPKTGADVRYLRGHTDVVWSIAFSPDSSKVVSGSEDKSLRIWSAEKGLQEFHINDHDCPVYATVFSPHESIIGSSSSDRTVRIWDAAKGQCKQILHGHKHRVQSIAFSPSQHHHIASGSDDFTIRIWNFDSGEQVVVLQEFDAVLSIAFSPEGSHIVCGMHAMIHLWDLNTEEQLMQIPGHSSWVNSVSFSPDGTIIASVSCDRSLRIWHTVMRKPLFTLEGHSDWVWSAAMSPDGGFIYTNSKDGTIWRWSMPLSWDQTERSTVTFFDLENASDFAHAWHQQSNTHWKVEMDQWTIQHSTNIGNFDEISKSQDGTLRDMILLSSNECAVVKFPEGYNATNWKDYYKPCISAGDADLSL